MSLQNESGSESNSGRTSAQDSLSERESKYDDIPEGSIFIGDLCKEVSEEDLRAVFQEYGEVVDVVIKRSRSTDMSLGYGFVTMKTAELAQACLSLEDDIVLKGRKLRIARAQRNTKLGIYNLSLSVTPFDLNSAFSVYGKLVEDATLITSDDGAKVGSVTFTHRADAERAKTCLQGQSLFEYPMKIDWLRSDGAVAPRSTTSSSAANRRYGSGSNYRQSKYLAGGVKNGRNSYNTDSYNMQYPQQLWNPVVSIHVKFCAPGEVSINEDVFYQAYRQFGPITAVSIKGCSYFPEHQRQRGYAFVHFEMSQAGRQAAYNAVNVMADITRGDIRFSSQLSRNFLKMEERCSALTMAQSAMYGSPVSMMVFPPGGYQQQPQPSGIGYSSQYVYSGGNSDGIPSQYHQQYNGSGGSGGGYAYPASMDLSGGHSYASIPMHPQQPSSQPYFGSCPTNVLDANYFSTMGLGSYISPTDYNICPTPPPTTQTGGSTTSHSSGGATYYSYPPTITPEPMTNGGLMVSTGKTPDFAVVGSPVKHDDDDGVVEENALKEVSSLSGSINESGTDESDINGKRDHFQSEDT